MVLRRCNCTTVWRWFADVLVGIPWRPWWRLDTATPVLEDADLLVQRNRWWPASEAVDLVQTCSCTGWLRSQTVHEMRRALKMENRTCILYNTTQANRPACNIDTNLSCRPTPPCGYFLSASLYFSKRGAYWDRLCRDVVGRWLVVTRVHCGQTVHPRPIVTMEH